MSNTMNSLRQNQDSPLSANGRFGRLSYLGWNMLLGLITVLIVTIIALIAPSILPTNPSEKLSIATIVFFVIIYAFMIYFSFIFTIRRLHDRDHSGWLSLVIFIPIINFFFILYLIFAPGTQGSNNFGAPRITKTWEKFLGWMYVLIFPLGILAAISIPAYQDYVKRAQQMQLEQNINHSE